ncbi:helix-turn-helix transcriptional regulator [Croceicoccus ponticola]|nr:helix-turn-helix transcriptional regulator [Croceicoccus ponticola]
MPSGWRSNDLEDFMTGLFQVASGVDSGETKADRAIALFYNYLHRIGVEFANFGTFEIADGKGDMDAFGGANMPGCFIEEYFARGWNRSDFVLRAGELLTPKNPESTFRIGLPALTTLPDNYRDSNAMIMAAGDAGLQDGLAFIGKSPLNPNSGRERYFGIALGGDKNAAGVANERLGEIKVAFFAMLQVVKPRLEALADGYGHTLTAREKDVLAMVARGEMRDQIGFRFNLSVPTVDVHLRSIRQKLNAQNLPEAVAKGMRYGVI